MKIKIFEYTTIKLLSPFGIDHQFFDIHICTLIYTWVAMFLLIGGALVARFFYMRKEYHPVSVILERSVLFFKDLCVESIGYFRYEYFAFFATMFFFTLYCNMVGLLPFVEEATRDLNTTLALGVSSFCYVQYQSIKENGALGYLKSFIEPLPFLFPLEVIGKLASIVSMSFRLFGNILGGSIVYYLLVQMFRELKIELPFIIFSYIILLLYFFVNKRVDLKKHKILSYSFFSCFTVIFFLTGAQCFFGLFESFVQAFVITMLTVTYLSVAISHGGDELAGEKQC